ncbi:PHD and RING finger domain-containing protein 1 [Cyprinodon tularosa]|uniref:PHD and RING finger domain-containing protein 1 n=1 Tax=Cyprinodon tularosa TaxID=77115 RepID=UPI0018E2546D|nr:PHD and RING finger domain-containing protein 1 [Cyprinodon tularosa]
MDEDDSQDEQVFRGSSHSKGKRSALWAISDDSDDLEEESEEGDSESGDEEEENNANREDEEEDEDTDEEDDNDEMEDGKQAMGACGGSSADFAEMSSDEDREKCPICLNSFSSQPVATPENCEHYFCFDCILEWTKNANSCPVDRIVFDNIYLRKSYGGKVKKIVTVQKPVKQGQEETVNLDLEQTNCEVCGGSDREDQLLLCDGCDAGYHMECLTPPLDAVPVEEWFCPECETNNRHLRGSPEEISDTESLSSTPLPATSRSQTRTVGPTRAIARTQQSERVRANVNRHRITQARTSQLAPTYLMQSTWLDETINAVVAGLNTAVYVRDITPRAPSSRRRKPGKRRKVRRKKTSAKGENSQSESTGVKRRKRRARRSKSRRKVIERKVATPRGRIANNLGIVKDKKSSSLPTVYRLSENTLSNMRADIGAASLSIYGDPFDLDPFIDHEEVEEQAQVTSLLEAKRRGISRSALRSHQPVARPVTAGLSRRGVDFPQSGSVAEAAPVPDLLGSILSGQSLLLMDSSDVVISRDGSLKASKPMMASTQIPTHRKTSSSSDISTLNSPGYLHNLGDSSVSLPHDGNLPGSSPTSVNGPSAPSSSHLPSIVPPSSNQNQPRPQSDLSSGANINLQPPRPNRPIPTNGMRSLREAPSPSVHRHQDSVRDKGTTVSQSQSKKAPVKPMWVDVSVLPRIPKIKRESSSVTNDGGVLDSSRGSSHSTGTSNGLWLPENAMTSLSRDQGRQQSVDQQKGHSDSQAHKNRSERATSSSSFSNSFASSSSTTSTSQARHAPFSSSSAVSFRINSSGNSWHARRLSITSASPAGSNIKEQWREKDQDKAKKKQMHKDKKTLLATCGTVGKEEDDIYDPFNPTLSDSSSSSDEAEATSLGVSLQSGTNREKPPTLGSNKGPVLKSQDVVQVKAESEETDASQEKPGSSQQTVRPERILSADFIKDEKESNLAKVKSEKQKFFDTIIKKEPNSDESERSDSESCGDMVISKIKSEIADTETSADKHVEYIKSEKNPDESSGPVAETSRRYLTEYRDDSSASSSSTISKKQSEDTKSDLPASSSALVRDLVDRNPPSKISKDQPSSSSETDRGRREIRHASDKGGKKKERDKGREKDRSSRRSGSKERRRAPSTSDSSQTRSPDKTHRKRWRSRSREKTRRRSRSCSSSSSTERSRMKKHKYRSKERNEPTERRRGSKEKRHRRSHSKSRSKSRSRSRTRSRSKDRKRRLSRSRSRSRSKERRKDGAKKHETVSSRDKVDSRSKDRTERTGFCSRERRKTEGSTRTTDKTASSSSLSSRETNDQKKEKDISERNLEKNKCAELKKQEFPSCAFVPQVKNEDKNFEGGENQTKEIFTEIKKKKEIKKEKPKPMDMFEDFPIGKEVKSEEKDLPSLAVSKSDQEIMEDHIKMESCEAIITKSESSPTQDCSSASVSSPPTMTVADPPHDSVCESEADSLESGKQQNTSGAAAPIKQEPSESDDDFNVDVILDSLDPVQSEPISLGAKDEKEALEGKDGGEQISLTGSKSKTQVKRVTWNIQEPEGPRPEKSASKLALYKLKLKQEGSRKPFLPVKESNQGTVGDTSKKSVAGLQTASSSSGSLNPEELATTEQREAEEGDSSRKDKYLKKLHMQERAVEEVKLAIKPFYQRRDINKDEYKEILRKAVQKVCHSKSGEINPVKVGNLIKAYVEKYKHARKHKKGEDSTKIPEDQSEPMKICDSP